MSTAIVTLSKYPDIFEAFKASWEEHEHATPKMVVIDGEEIDPPDGWGSDWGAQPFGFARNANVGINAFPDHDILLVNDDVTISGPVVLALETVAEAVPSAGIISPVIVGYVRNPDQRMGSKIESFAHLSPNLAFACVWLRRKMIDEIGLLDERFSCSYEDDDYCLRALLANWSCVVTDTITVRHGFGSDLSSSSIQRTYGGYEKILHENQRRFAEKWREEIG